MKEPRSLRWMPPLQPKKTTCHPISLLSASSTMKALMQYSHLGFVSHANQVRTPLLGGPITCAPTACGRSPPGGSTAIALPKQLRHPGEVHRHPPRLISGEHLGLAGSL